MYTKVAVGAQKAVGRSQVVWPTKAAEGADVFVQRAAPSLPAPFGGQVLVESRGFLITTILLWHILLTLGQYLVQILCVLGDWENFLLVEIRGDLLTQENLANDVAQIWGAGSVFKVPCHVHWNELHESRTFGQLPEEKLNEKEENHEVSSVRWLGARGSKWRQLGDIVQNWTLKVGQQHLCRMFHGVHQIASQLSDFLAHLRTISCCAHVNQEVSK